MPEPLERLFALLDEAFQILFVDNLGLNHAERTFIEVLEVLRVNGDARSWFLEKATKAIISGGEVIDVETNIRPGEFVDADLICFIAHATRWPAFVDATKTRRQTKAYSAKLPGSSDIADEVDAAQSDDWEDKEFYKYFG